MADEIHLLRAQVRCLEQVVNNIIINQKHQSIMTTKKKGNAGDGDQTPTPDTILEDQALVTPPPVGDVDTTGAGTPPPVETPQAPAFELLCKAYDVRDPRTGKITRVTAETLEKDPTLLQHMLTKHADCFKSVPKPPIEEGK